MYCHTEKVGRRLSFTSTSVYAPLPLLEVLPRHLYFGRRNCLIIFFSCNILLIARNQTFSLTVFWFWLIFTIFWLTRIFLLKYIANCYKSNIYYKNILNTNLCCNFCVYYTKESCMFFPNQNRPCIDGSKECVARQRMQLCTVEFHWLPLQFLTTGLWLLDDILK